MAFVLIIGGGIYTGADAVTPATSLEAASDLDHLFAAVKRPEAEVMALGKLTKLREDGIHTVQVAELINGNDERSRVLEESMTAHAQEILELQQALSTRRPILAALRKGALHVNQIVALHVANDGTVNLFCK
ncbi:MAG TPA: hypothetical protein VFG50_01030 [Rhodothermales bacterium]|nr:hypothetical protein [Rhodothermales bacterium]